MKKKITLIILILSLCYTQGINGKLQAYQKTLSG